MTTLVPPAQTPESAQLAEPALLSDVELARLVYGCSRSHVRNMDRLGLIPAPIRLGRLTRWRRDEALAHIAAGAPPRHRWHWRGGR